MVYLPSVIVLCQLLEWVVVLVQELRHLLVQVVELEFVEVFELLLLDFLHLLQYLH
jgi:hypothetical protein